jgi:hypothetical protein
MSIGSALTPTLSPRRGGAETASTNSMGLAALNAPSSVEIDLVLTATLFAPPLLGERAGVRADISSIHSFLP